MQLLQGKPVLRHLFEPARLLAAGILCGALAACGGGSSNGHVQVGATALHVRPGSTQTVTVGIGGSSGLINQKVSLSVSDPTVVQISPSTCAVSSENPNCVVTVSGKKLGAVDLVAHADGYTDVHSAVSVTGTANPYGTITVAASTQTFYAGATVPYPFAVTVQLDPGTGANAQVIPNANPLIVMMNTVPGITYSVPQCALTTAAPSCTISGTIDATKVTSASSFTTTVSPTGSWVAGVNAPFGSADNVTITWNGTTTQSAGTIGVASQNVSGNVYLGMKAPLFVYLSGDTLLQSAYTVTVTSNDPTSLVFYSYPDGSNDPTKVTTSSSVTCQLNLDNTSPATFATSQTSCGFGMQPLKGATGAGLPLSLSVTAVANSPTPTGYTPTYATTVHLNSIDNTQSTDGRTITFTNNTSGTVAIGMNAGSANAYTSPTSIAAGGDPTNPARSIPGAQSYCGPTSQGRNACPIGTTCVQGGASVSKGNTPFMCFWDKPGFANSTGILAAGASTTTFIPQWSGLTSGGSQAQWSGNYYVQACPGGTCPSMPTTPGTGPSDSARTLAEVTYQHNAVDFYDVSIINGANFAMAFGPTSGQGEAPSTAAPYSCGQPGASSFPGAVLPNSSWAFSPSQTGSFPPDVTISDSPASYFAVVTPTSTTPTSCTTQSACTGSATGGNVCGWSESNVLTGTFSFGAPNRVCGSFVAWASANQIWGWNESATANVAPFDFGTSNTVSPAFNGQSSISVSDLQLCTNNSFSSYTSPAPPNQPAVMACGGTNWTGITTPATPYTTQGPAWVQYVLPTITWLKKACPTCYAFPFDDMSSTFTCEKGVVSTGSNYLNYTLTVTSPSNTFN